MTRTVLIGFDHSEASTKALEWVLNHNILLPSDKIYIVTVLNDEILAFEGFGLEAAAIGPATWVNDDCGEVASKVKQDAGKLLRSVLEVLEKKGLTAIPKVLNGDAGDALVVEAEHLKADLVIVGSNGRGFIKRSLLGSISQHLTNNLHCSVLVVKP
ncbi:hypothetical protein BJ944DRAFT_171067 [Cunninghamella echinulata]|nr:hypothetical protein BJ944DRAFT_171067 [Cunninghamella echinulata]